MSEGINKIIKFGDLATQSTITAQDYLVGMRDDGNGNLVDFKYSTTGISGTTKKRIEILSDGKTVTDNFFENILSEIVTNGQAYLWDVDFTQDTGTKTVTFINLDLVSGQIILAKI